MPARFVRFAAVAFGSLIFVQLCIGALLFYLLIGFSAQDVMEYYRIKSFHGLLETLIPHLLFISIVLMATLHFLAFVQTKDNGEKVRLSHTLFILFLVDQTSPIAIAQGVEIFAYVKIGAFLGFELILGWVWMIIFTSSLKAA